MPEQDQVDVRVFWGKAGRAKAGEETVPHPLICHTVDTAAVAEILYTTLLGSACRAQLTETFTSLGGDVRSWVALLCGLHDLGKLSPAFQALRADVAVSLLPEMASAEVESLAGRRTLGGRTDTFHGILTAYHFRRLLKDWGASTETALVLAQVLGGHHGSFFADTLIQNGGAAKFDNGGERWAGWAEALVCQTAELLGLPDPRTLPWSAVRIGTGAAVALAGLATVSDWIASGSIDKSTHAGADVDLFKYVELSRERAREQVVDRLGWSAWSPSGDVSFACLFAEQPRPLQVATERLVGSKNRPGILVIEAPTGEGKTKGALQCVVSLIRQLGLAGFFVAMPTRATSNQMFDEVEELLRRLDSTVTAKLLHGTAAEYLADRRAQAARAEVIRPEDVGGDGSDGAQDEAVREWFTRAKALLAPLAVGTIDRVLQGGIRSRWAPVPLVGLSNRVLVLDEVHGYEVYMSTILDRLLWWLGWFEVPVILLSATLPAVRRKQLVHSWYAGIGRCRPHEVELVLPPAGYPRALWIDGRGAPELVEAVASETNSNRRVALAHLGDHVLVEWALRHAARGQGVAIIHNIHSRITNTLTALREAVGALPEAKRPKVVEITGQLAHAQRAKIEAKLKSLFGRNGKRAPETGYIVVGTQVLEQSLDLDFDVMASDPAPADSLIQRAGRLHRFRPTDPRTPPTFAILGVTEQKTGPKWPAYTTNIYQDLVLLRTWALLRDRTELRLPDDIPTLVDATYPGTDNLAGCPAGWEKRWVGAIAKMRRTQDADQAMARDLFLPPPTREDALLDLTRHPKNISQTRKPDPRGRRND
ncbi:CRISPR-associated helicase Cas3' [Micromonospora sp. NBC_01796]|uniref:CRISPR-associated helicase Cas3' n=1 Tax=Micromonospora sp. NBC_01796 TaxID=2975987 RepID=UPI002DDAAC87|nr:CRISPR-associated helicase Cas3' [Micromonospora sp. NBC_01796]WSA83819.1 CRISPR-associated helicase Cas3' [Micromonospora sp. NBC_01796]